MGSRAPDRGFPHRLGKDIGLGGADRGESADYIPGREELLVIAKCCHVACMLYGHHIRIADGSS